MNHRPNDDDDAADENESAARADVAERRHGSGLPPARVNPDELEYLAYIGAGTTFVGTASSAGSIRVEGMVEGEIHSGRVVVLSASAQVKGQVHAKSILVLGASVEGNLIASESVEIRKGARVRGDITAPSVLMDPDIEFSGRCEKHPAV